MKSGVDSLTCGCGGWFHDGMGGSSSGEWAAAARGKLSTTGGPLDFLDALGTGGDGDGCGVELSKGEKSVFSGDKGAALEGTFSPFGRGRGSSAGNLGRGARLSVPLSISGESLMSFA